MNCQCHENQRCQCLDRSAVLGRCCTKAEKTVDLWRYAADSPATGRIVLLCTPLGVHWELCPHLSDTAKKCLCMRHYFRECRKKCKCDLCRPTLLSLVNTPWGNHVLSCIGSLYPPDTDDPPCDCHRAASTSHLWTLANRKDALHLPVCVRRCEKLAAFLGLEYALSVHGGHFSDCEWSDDDAVGEPDACDCGTRGRRNRWTQDMHLTASMDCGVTWGQKSERDCMDAYKTLIDHSKLCV